MTNPTQINQGGAENQAKQPKRQAGSHATDDEPRNGPEAQKLREKTQRQENAGIGHKAPQIFLGPSRDSVR